MTADPSTPTTLIVAARAWFDAGYCVVPTHEDGGKRPFSRWKEFQSQRPSWAEVEQWLESGTYTGIGVILGAASGNVEAIEIEGPMDKAVERLSLVVEKSREYAQIALPDLLVRIAQGCVEQSGGGGLHLFIRVTDGPALGNTKLAMIGQGTERKVVSETRGEGGFMVVAPTPGRNGHPEGASYIFINGGSPDKTVDVTSEERDLLHLLFTLALDEADERELEVERARAERVLTPAAVYDGVSAFDDYRARVTWREILEPAGWTYSHRDSEREYWVRPGKSVRDGHSASTIEDGPLVNFSSSIDWPLQVGMSKGQVYALLHHGGDLSAAAKALQDSGYGTPPPSRELTPWEFTLDPDATDEEKAEAAANWVTEHLPRIDWHKEFAADHDVKWIVEPLIAEGRLIAVYSAPKVGKSLVMLEIAAAIASGRAVLGMPGGRRVRVLYVDLENTAGDIVSRLESMGFTPDDLDELVYLSFPTMSALDTERGAKELLAAVLHYGCVVVVIDTVSRLISGEENDNTTWLKWYRQTGVRLKARGVSVIRLDHSGKDESKGQRGGSAKSGDVDAVWRMSKRGDDIIDFVCEAQRFQITQQMFTVKRAIENGRLTHKVAGNPYKEKRDAVIEKLVAAGVPKDSSITVRKATKMVRDAGLSCASGEIRKDFLEFYANLPDTWDQLLADTDG